jgi:hypothetical protein
VSGLSRCACGGKVTFQSSISPVFRMKSELMETAGSRLVPQPEDHTFWSDRCQQSESRKCSVGPNFCAVCEKLRKRVPNIYYP